MFFFWQFCLVSWNYWQFDCLLDHNLPFEYVIFILWSLNLSIQWNCVMPSGGCHWCIWFWYATFRSTVSSNRYEHESGLNNLINLQVLIISKKYKLEIEKLKFQIMDQTFVQLSELCQKVINLLRGGKKPEQIATILEMSNANTVTRRKFACMASWIELVKMDKMYYLIKNWKWRILNGSINI